MTSVTLSKEQKQYAEDQIALQSPEVRARIQILLLDYRLLPEHFPNRRFDKIVSIEMIEAVGPEFLSTFFTTCDQMLNAHTGVMAFQCITASSLQPLLFIIARCLNRDMSRTVNPLISFNDTSFPAAIVPASPPSSPPSIKARLIISLC